MDLKEKKYRVLLISPSENFLSSIKALLSDFVCSQFCTERSISSAKRRLAESSFDFILLNLPPNAENAYRFSVDLCREKSSVVLMFVPAQEYDAAFHHAAAQGIYLLPKPVSRSMVTQAFDWMVTTHERLRKMEKKTLSVEEKMQEIRMVNRAKWLLIEQMNMTEAEAHRYIEKRAMDRCVSRREIAEEIIGE